MNSHSAPRDGVDACRRAFRRLQEAAKQLDERQRRHGADLFGAELVAMRMRLSEVGSALALRRPHMLGRRCEQLVWRSAFHAPYAQAKQRPHVAAGGLRVHLAAGVAFYQQFLMEIHAHFQLEAIVDFVPAHGRSQLSTQQTKEKIHDEKDIEWASGAVGRCLIALGDLHRYLSLQAACSEFTAARFYTMASLMEPGNSMPFNQLGTLASASGRSLDATLYYLRCLTCETPFEGAEANLQQVLRQRKQPGVLLQSFLALVHDWCFPENAINANKLNEECMSKLKELLSPEAPEPVGSELLVKIVCVCALCCYYLQAIGSKQDANARLFLVSLFGTLSSTLVNCSAPPEALKRRKKTRMRRRANHLLVESDESEGEDGGSASSEHSSEDEAVSSSSGSWSDSDPPVVNPRLHSRHLAALAALKLCCDWLRADQQHLNMLSGHCLKDFVQLLNILTYDCKLMVKAMRVRNSLEEVLVKCEPSPLPEDAHLRNHLVLHQSTLEWKLLDCNPYKSDILLRLCKVIKFGIFLTGCSEPAGVEFDSNSSSFKLTEQITQQTNTAKVVEVEKTANRSSSEQQKQLMQNMGQLWLQEEVRSLEQRVCTVVSPLLVPDASALLRHLPLAKKLAASRQFVIVVPISVLESLDHMKKESARAREASRWLETQLHKGNRFLRAQKATESLALPLITSPNKRDKDARCLMDVMECCHFLAQQQQEEGQEAAASLVTILTSNTNDSSEELVMLSSSIGINVENISVLAKQLKPKKKGAK